MRKKLYTRIVGVLLSDDSYQQLVDTTDKLEITLSEYLRSLIDRELKESQKEEDKNE
jgi:hypothetical protein